MKTNLLASMVLGFAVLATRGASGQAAVPEGGQSLEELKQQVRVLQARVEELSADKVSREDVDAVVRAVLRDANERSQLFSTDGTLTAGYDKGFFIRSEDGSFLFKPSLMTQFRGVANFADDSDGEDYDSGFELRRVRLRFDGNVFSEKLTYQIQYDASRTSGTDSLLDAWAQYRFADEWALKAGQYKLSFSRERDLGPNVQMAVDRTLVDTLIGGGQTNRVQGVALTYGGTKDNPVRVEYSVDDGALSQNTDFRDTNTSFGTGGRVEFKFAGDWSAYKDFTARGTKETLAVLGGGAHFNDTVNGNLLFSTVDFQLEFDNGLAFFAAAHGRSLFERNDGGEDDTFDSGFIAQASYMFNKSWEGFARYDYLKLDGVSGEDTFNEIALGVNYYLGKDGAWGHRAKITTDVVYLPDGGPGGATGIDVVGSDDAQFVFRTQFTLQI